MTFRQIIAQYSPVDSKSKLNKLLAAVERNFGVFSPDMELDLRSIISVPEVVDYFDRIIHEAHPVLEYDKIKTSQNNSHQTNTRVNDVNLIRRLEKKKRKKEARKLAKKNPLSPLTMEKDDYGKSKSVMPVHLSKTDRMLQELARNGRDYSKPTLESQLNRSRHTEGKERPKQWLKIVSVPMGGQNKKY